MKIGYKGFKNDLTCREQQFEIDQDYFIEHRKVYKSRILSLKKPAANNSLKLCSPDVFHYCNKLDTVYSHYALNENHRFFKIQILGEYKDDYSKSGTTAFRFLEELDAKELIQAKKDKEEERKLKLPLIRSITEKFPNMIIGGSLALYLQGAKLSRLIDSGVGDFDLIHPFWIDMTEIAEIEHEGGKNSGNTFDETFSYQGIKIDLCIDNKGRYRTVEYKGHKYRVNSVEEILYYKSMYARQASGRKHKNDINELLGIDLQQKNNSFEPNF